MVRALVCLVQETQLDMVDKLGARSIVLQSNSIRLVLTVRNDQHESISAAKTKSSPHSIRSVKPSRSGNIRFGVW